MGAATASAFLITVSDPLGDRLMLDIPGPTDPLRFTTITTSTVVDGTNVITDINAVNDDRLFTGSVNNNSVTISSTLGNDSLVVFNGPVAATNQITATGTGTTRVAFNGAVATNQLVIVEPGLEPEATGSSTVVVGSSSTLTVSNSIFLGRLGTGIGELVVSGTVTTSGLFIGVNADTNGSLACDALLGGVRCCGGCSRRYCELHVYRARAIRPICEASANYGDQGFDSGGK